MQNEKLKKHIEENQDYDNMYSNIMEALKVDEGNGANKTDENQKL